MRPPGFFDLEERLAKLDGLGEPLAKIAQVVDWDGFRPALNRALDRMNLVYNLRPLAWRQANRRAIVRYALIGYQAKAVHAVMLWYLDSMTEWLTLMPSQPRRSF